MALRSARIPSVAAVAAAAAAYAWFVTGLYPFTWPAFAGTVTGGVIVVATTTRRGTREMGLEPRPGATDTGLPGLPGIAGTAGIVVWAVLVLALATWEVAAFVQHPRPDHPTLSSLANGVFDSHATRAVAFLAWLGVGAGLARR